MSKQNSRKPQKYQKFKIYVKDIIPILFIEKEHKNGIGFLKVINDANRSPFSPLRHRPSQLSQSSASNDKLSCFRSHKKLPLKQSIMAIRHYFPNFFCENRRFNELHAINIRQWRTDCKSGF